MRTWFVVALFLFGMAMGCLPLPEPEAQPVVTIVTEQPSSQSDMTDYDCTLWRVPGELWEIRFRVLQLETRALVVQIGDRHRAEPSLDRILLPEGKPASRRIMQMYQGEHVLDQLTSRADFHRMITEAPHDEAWQIRCTP